MNPISQRLLNQQLICPQFGTPHEVVAWMGAMQAQEYRMMRWAVEMRTKRPSARAFEKAYNEGQIVRVHLFRTTWQLVTGEDLGWMLELCRDKALRGLAGWMHANCVDIPLAEQESIQLIFNDFLSKSRIAQKADFASALEDRGITMEDHRLSYHIRLAEYSGLLCSGDLFPLKHSYALSADKLPQTPRITKEEALAKLARTYFRSHGPATLEDFVWWSGLNIGDCRKGINAIQNELIEERWDGLSFLRHQDCRTRGFRSGTVTLLPSYDEYLIGDKSRHVAVNHDHMHRAHSGNGIFWPVILQNGAVIGNWSAAGGQIKTEIFHPEAGREGKALAAEIAAYQAFLKK